QYPGFGINGKNGRARLCGEHSLARRLAFRFPDASTNEGAAGQGIDGDRFGDPRSQTGRRIHAPRGLCRADAPASQPGQEPEARRLGLPQTGFTSQIAAQERERAGPNTERTANRLPARRMILSKKGVWNLGSSTFSRVVQLDLGFQTPFRTDS